MCISVYVCVCFCVRVFVCSVSMSCHIKGNEFPQQEEPSLLLLYKPACNRLSARAAFKSKSTSVSDNKTDDSLASQHHP